MAILIEFFNRGVPHQLNMNSGVTAQIMFSGFPLGHVYSPTHATYDLNGTYRIISGDDSRAQTPLTGIVVTDSPVSGGVFGGKISRLGSREEFRLKFGSAGTVTLATPGRVGNGGSFSNSSYKFVSGGIDTLEKGPPSPMWEVVVRASNDNPFGPVTTAVQKAGSAPKAGRGTAGVAVARALTTVAVVSPKKMAKPKGKVKAKPKKPSSPKGR